MYNGDVNEAQHTHKLSKIERCAGNGHGLLAYDGVFSAIAEGINVNTPRKKGEKNGSRYSQGLMFSGTARHLESRRDRISGMADFFRRLGGVVVAVCGIAMVRKTARQQATLEFITQYNDSSVVSEGIHLIHDPEATQELISALESGKHLQKESILSVLNKFEILAVGLEQGIYDYDMVKNCFGYEVGKFFQLSGRIIHCVRVKHPKAFVSIEKLAKDIGPGE